jgi:sulfate/thiosulfate-binding protein
MARTGPSLAARFAVALAAALLVAGCAERPQRRSGSVTVRFAGYTAAREVYGEGLLPGFARSWRERTGQEVLFEQSYGPSRAQSDAIRDGLEADVAALAVEPDVDPLVQEGLVDSGWRFSDAGGVYSNSLVVLVVRSGNPQGIRDWSDLARPGVRVVTPDPRTSGGGRWNVCAVYGAALRGHAGAKKFDTQSATALLSGVLANVVPMSRGARESFDAFVQGAGDVAITYESEALAGLRAGLPIEYVVPPSTMIVELPVVMIRKNAERSGAREVVEALLEFLETDEARRIFLQYGLRAVDPAAEAPANARPTGDLWTVGFLGGWTRAADELFGSEGAFTRSYSALHASE